MANIPFIKINPSEVSLKVLLTIPEKVARRQKAVAFFRDKKTVKIALLDEKNTDIAAMVAKKTELSVKVYLASKDNINNVLLLYRKDLQAAFDGLVKEAGTSLDSAPVIKLVDLLITYAYDDRASDIHIEPQENSSLIRFRIDGVLHDVLTFPKILHDRIATRIKVLSRLRTDEHLAAQDGKMRLQLEDENLDIRVSIIPIVEGEKAVLRLLSSRSREYTLSGLGMADRDLEKVERTMKKSYGMILSTGPTGSGKTTSIYAILKVLNGREKNITTIEDPVEYRIKGVNQIQVNAKTNLTFANGLASILRQDPNVIFVGEIRDNQTAGIAVNAALTGHLVLTTLHTNDAVGALPRLMDMNVEPLLVASTVSVIIAQRLLRTICEECKSSRTITVDELEKSLPKEVIKKNFGKEKKIKLFMGAGCNACHKTGYVGRIGIFEVLLITKTIRKLIIEKKDSDEIAQQALTEGMTTMLDDGLLKVNKGITTLEEVLRVTKTESF